MRTARVFIALVLLLSSCTLGPDYQRPDQALPGSYRGAPAGASLPSIAGLPWWEMFDDPVLNDLIAIGLENNLDLQLAAARLAEANAVAAAARAPLRPELSAGLTSSPTARLPGDQATTTFLGGLLFSWQIDFWGRYARASEAAQAELLASEAGRDGVRASLVASLAQGYFSLQSLRATAEITENTIEAQRQSLNLVVRLAEAGVSSAAEVRQAENQLATTESRLPEIRVSIGQMENSLSLLLGRHPGPLGVSRTKQAPLWPVIPVGLPADLLERRPDLRQAEQGLIAANARVGEAKALFFPSISLTGTLGGVSTELSDLLKGDAATVVSPGIDLLQPLYAGGRLEANYQANLARLEQAGLAYRKTGLKALQEVADALIEYDLQAVTIAANYRREVAAREGLRLAGLRYRSGVVSYLEILDAQRQLYSAETERIQSELSRRTAAVALYLALGGGWEDGQP